MRNWMDICILANQTHKCDLLRRLKGFIEQKYVAFYHSHTMFSSTLTFLESPQFKAKPPNKN